MPNPRSLRRASSAGIAPKQPAFAPCMLRDAACVHALGRGTCQKYSFPIEPAPPSRRECELSRAARPRAHCHVEDRVRSLMSNCVHWMHCTCPLVSGSRSRTGPLVSGRRSTECDIVLQGGLLSRVHAIIRRTLLPGDCTPTFTLEDRSANGIWLRGKRMPKAQPQTMVAGDEFCLGSASRCVRLRSHGASAES